MIKKTIKYKDFDGNPQEDTFYFNLTRAELVKLEASASGGLGATIQQIVETRTTTEIVPLFERILMMAYGEKSPDGRHFMKTEEKALAFKNSAAYDALFMELFSNVDAAADFVNGLMPEGFDLVPPPAKSDKPELPPPPPPAA